MKNRLTKIIISLLFVSFLGIFTACIGGFVLKKHLAGNVYLAAGDSGEESALMYPSENNSDTYLYIIGPTVFSVGYNEKYIIAKQCPNNAGRIPYSELDRSKPNYYIVPVDSTNDYYALGPFSKEQFDRKCEELKIDIQFTFEIF
jgi:hypothetical protein